MQKMRSGGQLLIDCLLKQGADRAFGVPGESYLAVLDALFDVKDRFQLIVSRHEGGAAFMAEAYGKLTGRPGLCFVTRGPGATNAAIGVHTARQNSTPMILFIGQIARDTRDREAFQEIDYRAFYGGIAKWVTEIQTAQRIPEIIARAYNTALSGRPGPVVVALPEDMLRELSDVPPAEPVSIARAAPTNASLSAAVSAMERAQKPLVLVGGGGWTDAGRHDLREFAEKNNLPVAVAFRFQDLMDNSSPSYMGDAGVGMAPYLKAMIRESDLIFAMNIRFGESTTDAWRLLDVPNPAQTLIHAHGSDAEIGKIYQPDVPIQSDPDELVSVLAGRNAIGDWSEWRDQGRKGFSDMKASATQQGPLDMVEVCRLLDATLSDDAIITNGAGNFAIWPSKFLTFRGKRRLLAPQSGAMGAGLPAAIAAKSTYPERQVVCFAGDGDFQMVLAEMGTALQQEAQPVILLFNNGMYGTIRAHQERHYPGRVSGTSIKNPDFLALARAYGFAAAKVEKTGQFAEAFHEISTSASGGLIELMINPQDITPFSSLAQLSKATH